MLQTELIDKFSEFVLLDEPIKLVGFRYCSARDATYSKDMFAREFPHGQRRKGAVAEVLDDNYLLVCSVLLCVG
jgi:hypothetical protein